MLKQMLKKILILFLFGSWSAEAETKAEQAADNPVVILKKKKDQKNKQVKIKANQILKLLVAKLQNMKQAPDNNQMQALFNQTREEIAALYASYLNNKEKLLKDPEFLNQLLFTAILLNREMMVGKIAKTLPESVIKAELDEMLSKVPTPMLYKLKAIVLNSQEKAQRAIAALEAGTPFEQISKESIKSGEFENGNVLDKQTGSQFINLFSNAIPDQVKAALQGYNQENKSSVLIKTPIVVAEEGKTTYWVVRLEQVKKGSKKDLPTIDLKDERLRNGISNLAAGKKFMEESKKTLEEFEVEYFKPDGSADK